MKKKVLLIFLLLSTISFSQKVTDKINSNSYIELDVNNVKFGIDSYDIDDIDQLRSGGKAHWILDIEEYYGIVFDQGMWLVGKIQDSVRAGIRQWYYQYSRGPIINGKPAMEVNPQDSNRYRIYKITEGDDALNSDYTDWPSDLGAPVDSLGNPKLYGDQTLWTLYNMYDTSKIYYSPYDEKEELIIPVEVRETAYTHASITNADDDLLSNIVFIEYKFTNKSEFQIDSAYWSFWTDIDFYTLYENHPLIDVPRQLGLCYSFSNGDDVPWPVNVPTLGYTLLYGPAVYSQDSVAVFDGKVKENYKNLKLNTFHPILDDSYSFPDNPPDTSSRYINMNIEGPIDTHTQAWNISRGYGLFGWPYYDPFNNENTHFPYSGDPITETGWYSLTNSPDDYVGSGAGFVFSTGPFTLAPEESNWAMIALIPALGEDNFDSITKLRNKVDQLRAMPYDSLAVSNRIVSSVKDDKDLKLDYALEQNYPNPFNPTTRIEYTIPQQSNVKIEIFNLLGQQVSTLINTEQNAGRHFVNWNASTFSSGVYFYKINAGSFIETKKMMLVK